MTARTSTMWDTWRALWDALGTLDLGQHLHAQSPPLVHFGQPLEEWGEEHITLHSVIDSPVEQQWWTYGPGTKEESFGMLLTVQTAVPGADAWGCVDRLETMTSAIEEHIASTSLSLATGARRPDVPGVQWWTLTTFAPEILPGPNGQRGRVRIVVNVRSRL